MRISNRVCIALAVALLAGAAACQKDHKAEQLKALDKAFLAGVYSREEYDAKKQAILATAAGAAAVPAAPAASAAVTPATPAPPGGVPSSQATPAPPPIPDLPPMPTTPSAPAPPAAPRRPDAASRPSTPSAPRPPAPPQSPPAVPQIPPATPPEQPSIRNPPATAARPKSTAAPDDAEPAPEAGCTDTEFRPGGAELQEKFFPASMQAVHRAASSAFVNLDFNIQKDGKDEMEASKRKHLSAVIGAGGEKVILHFESAQKGGQSGTRVTSETKRSVVGKISQKSWTSAVLAQIGCNLKK